MDPILRHIIREELAIRRSESKTQHFHPELSRSVNTGRIVEKQYLGELAKGDRLRFEAKLLILGDANEGKTCVSRALRSLPFCHQSTTHGVDVDQWKFAHPDAPSDKSKEITLNIWDFEGQEISHQTHQFFLTSQALYLLVFRCREKFLMERAEYWLDTIRARAPQAKVAIVISECEERTPYIPQDRIVEHYSEMLADEWLFTVGCANGRNFDRLRPFLQRSAAALKVMAVPWPMSYEKTETALRRRTETGTTHLSRAALNDILHQAGVSAENYPSAAESMACIGTITHFPDSPELSDFVVLKPQWLTKAISRLMENAQLSEDKGEIRKGQMKDLWAAAGHPGMFATFHACMKEFELCYDLEDQAQTCLVPLRFGYVHPPIPWAATPGLKERRMEYKLNIRPPMGIMSRFIVKTHHMIVKTAEHPKGIFWYNGVFLQTNSPVPSQALCEFLPEERLFRVRVRAAFPQNLCEQIHAYVQAVFSFFDGLTAERSYGCLKKDADTGAELPCTGLHTEKRIYTAISRERAFIDCEFEEHEVDPRLLVSSMSSFGYFVSDKLIHSQVQSLLREEMDKLPKWAEPYLDRIQSVLGWVRGNDTQLQQLLIGQAALSAEFKQQAELKLHDYLHAMSEMLDNRKSTAAPGIISIRAKDRSAWNPATWFSKTYVLTPYCECIGSIHPCEDGSVEFTKDRAWWEASAPWIARGTNLLGAGLRLAYAGLPLGLGSEPAKLIEDELKFMDALTEHLKLTVPEAQDTDASALQTSDGHLDLSGNGPEAARVRSTLARFLEATAPASYHSGHWGSLTRHRTRDGSYRWLCPAHARK